MQGGVDQFMTGAVQRGNGMNMFACAPDTYPDSVCFQVADLRVQAWWTRVG